MVSSTSKTHCRHTNHRNVAARYVLKVKTVFATRAPLSDQLEENTALLQTPYMYFWGKRVKKRRVGKGKGGEKGRMTPLSPGVPPKTNSWLRLSLCPDADLKCKCL